MFETSKDALYIVLAFSALWLTLFISWFLFYMIMIVKRASDITKSIKAKLDLAERVLNTIKDKVEHSSTHLTLLVQSIGKIIEYAVDMKASKTADKSKKTSKKTPNSLSE